MKKSFAWVLLLLTGCHFASGPKMAAGGDRGVDSMIYHAEMSDFACYYPSDKYDREQLENIAALLMSNGSFPDRRFEFWRVVKSGVPVVDLNTYHEHIFDSMSRVKLPDFEPWVTFRERITDYNRRQFARNALVNDGVADPRKFYTYEGLSQDSVLRRCVDILAEGGDSLVDNTRRCMALLYSRTWRDNAQEIEYEINRLKHRLALSDSVAEAKQLLYQTIANRINTQVHEQNDILADGNFFRYEQEFLKLFDSLREFNINEP